MGLDVEGVVPRKTMFGFPNHRWKPWRMPDGLGSAGFRTVRHNHGRQRRHPDLSRRRPHCCPPAGACPRTATSSIPSCGRNPLTTNTSTRKTTSRSSAPYRKRTSHICAGEAARAALTGRAVIANFGGTAFGDIALVPGPFLKHPKGIRDIAEWYISTRTRRDYIHEVFSKQCDFALANLQKIYAVVGDTIDAVFLCGTDFGTQTSAFCSAAAFHELYFPYYQRMNDWIHQHTQWKTFKHSCGSVARFIPGFHRGRIRYLEPGAVLRRGYGRGISEIHLRRQAGLLGRWRGHPERAAVRDPCRSTRASPRTLRDFLPRWRVRVQYDSQYSGTHTGCKHHCHARCSQ